MTTIAEFFAKNIGAIPRTRKDEAPLRTLPVKKFIDKISFILFHTNSVTMLDVTINDVLRIDLNRLGVW